MSPRASLVIPVYNEAASIEAVLLRLLDSTKTIHEINVVYDFPEDTTRPLIERLSKDHPLIKPVLNTYGRGPANAIKYGIDHSQERIVVVTMADGCDDPNQIDSLVKLVDRGVVVACASRYARSGQQVGGPLVKSAISRLAGVSLYWFARVGTRDATNSFKAYSRDFIGAVGIESKYGFEIGIELVSKARRFRQPVAEIPTIWLDRTLGESNFKLLAWLLHYLRWYVYAFGRRKQLNNK